MDGDDHAIKNLVASLVANWNQLDSEQRTRIYDDAISGKIFGTGTTVQLKQQIDDFLKKNGAAF